MLGDVSEEPVAGDRRSSVFPLVYTKLGWQKVTKVHLTFSKKKLVDRVYDTLEKARIFLH
jgi:hypothetical protein